MPLSWWTLLNQYGFPLAALVVVCLFVFKYIWPFLTKQIEKSIQQREDQLKESQKRMDTMTVQFLEALRHKEELSAAVSREMVTELRNMNKDIRGLSHERAPEKRRAKP